jgi:hypothetical protein
VRYDVYSKIACFLVHKNLPHTHKKAFDRPNEVVKVDMQNAAGELIEDQHSTYRNVPTFNTYSSRQMILTSDGRVQGSKFI